MRAHGMRLLLAIVIVVAALAPLSGAWAAPTSTTTLAVTGMCCGSCTPRVTKALMSMKGVVAARMKTDMKTMVVDYRPGETTPKQLVEQLPKLTNGRYTATVKS